MVHGSVPSAKPCQQRKENTMTEYKRVREEVAKWVFLPLCGVPDEIDIEWDFCGENMQQNCRYIAGQILSLNGIEIKSDDQSLPETPQFPNCQLANVCCIPLISKYQLAQQDMLKAGFIKVAPKE